MLRTVHLITGILTRPVVGGKPASVNVKAAQMTKPTVTEFPKRNISAFVVFYARSGIHWRSESQCLLFNIVLQ
jgi:hypothetical protein